MDLVSLRDERSRVSEEFRAKLASLATLRSRLANAKTDVGRRLLYRAVDKDADLCRRLSAKLFELDELISAIQSRAKQPQAKETILLQTAPQPVAGIFPID